MNQVQFEMLQLGMRPHENDLAIQAARMASGLRVAVGNGKRPPGTMTEEEATRAVGANRGKVKMARRLLKVASPAVLAACRNGMLSLAAALNFCTRVTSQEEQDRHLPDILRHRSGKFVHVQKALGIPDADRAPKPKLMAQMDAGLQSLRNFTSMMAERLQESDVRNHPSMAQWMEELYDIRLSITHILKQHRPQPQEEDHAR